MKRIKGVSLVSADTVMRDIRYTVITAPQDYERSYPCIIVKGLNPDYYLLFGSLQLIITEEGGVLSHLAIVAREHNVPIIVAENILSQIPKRGVLSIKNQMIEVETDGKNK